MTMPGDKDRPVTCTSVSGAQHGTGTTAGHDVTARMTGPVLGLLLGGAVLVGASVLVNDEQRLDQLQNRVDDLRADLPSTGELRDELPE